MQKDFLKSKIETGFEQERALLEHEIEKKEPLPILSYVRPVFLGVLLSVTLIALVVNGFEAIKFFLTH